MLFIFPVYNTRHVQSQQSGKWPTREDPSRRRYRDVKDLGWQKDRHRTRVIEDSLSLPRDFALGVLQQLSAVYQPRRGLVIIQRGYRFFF